MECALRNKRRFSFMIALRGSQWIVFLWQFPGLSCVLLYICMYIRIAGLEENNELYT